MASSKVGTQCSKLEGCKLYFVTVAPDMDGDFISDTLTQEVTIMISAILTHTKLHFFLHSYCFCMFFMCRHLMDPKLINQKMLNATTTNSLTSTKINHSQGPGGPSSLSSPSCAVKGKIGGASSSVIRAQTPSAGQ